MVKTLAYQLAQSLPALRNYYCELDPGTLMQLNQPDTACRELLVWPLQKHLAKGQEVGYGDGWSGVGLGWGWHWGW